MWELQRKDDINSIAKFFSYDHFYVIYTTFWKLDSEGKQEIPQDVLAR